MLRREMFSVSPSIEIILPKAGCSVYLYLNSKFRRNARLINNYILDELSEIIENDKYSKSYNWSFCKKHFREWVNETHDRKNFSDIDYVKEVRNGVAAKKFGDNPNPNIREKLKAEFAKEFYKKLSNKQKEEYEEETAVIRENKKKPQAGKVHKFKAAKYTHPNSITYHKSAEIQSHLKK